MANSTTTTISLHEPLSPNQNHIVDNFSTAPKKSLLKLDSLSLNSPSYTSLRDVLPFSAAAVNSPTAPSSSSTSSASSAAAAHHISIRNRLVKQAARAYLQPMSASPSGPSGRNFFRRRVNPLATCLSFIVPCFTRIFHAIRARAPIHCFFA
ncbi:hypothetical protein RJT34_23747 [Clitoria ternatea]|uniref:Uncharacterized protein n=1 Tax=Clitoria ternatea TaxID=43366 RepID=A0AAN9IL45_CLITE